MSKKNRNYWKDRFKIMEEAQNERSMQMAKEIKELFDRSMIDIEKKIAHWYYRVAENNEVSMAKAMQMVSKRDLKEFRWTIEEYIKYGRENAKNQKWMKELENASARVHIGWLEMLKYEIRAETEKLFDDYTNKIDTHIMNTYMKDYYHTAYEIQKGFGVGSSLQRLDRRMVEKVIYKPWAVDGRNFSERIWDNRIKLVNTLHKSLSVMCITGAAPDQAIREVAKEMGVSRNRAGTLVMTESAAFANKARQECMEELNVEEFEVVETLDTITCNYCQEMDGKHFPMDQHEIGVTSPPFHPNCRGCTCPYFHDEFMEGGERAARGEDGKTYYVPADMTYKEWYKEFVENSSKSNKSDRDNNQEGDTNWTQKKKSDKINSMDITKEWTTTNGTDSTLIERKEYTVDGVTYQVDGKHVVFRPTEQERVVATILSEKYGKRVELVPQVMYPQGIQTPDYLIDGERFDLKSFKSEGKNVIYNMISKKKNQAPNFIFDFTKCSLSESEIERQIKNVYSSTHTRFIKKIVVMKDGNIIKVYERK